jgi:hypothetical protein
MSVEIMSDTETVAGYIPLTKSTTDCATAVLMVSVSLVEQSKEGKLTE